VDYVTMARNTDARDVGLAHGVLDIVVVVLFFIAMLLMLDDGATSGAALTWVLILHLSGVGLLALSGWLGGEMVFRHHLGMVPDDGELERAETSRHELRGSRARR
jgi:uncharacterized membrane protein